MSGAFGDVIVTKVGLGGFSALPSQASEAPWIQNLVLDTDGSWRPRPGLDLIYDAPARIALLEAAVLYLGPEYDHQVFAMDETGYIRHLRQFKVGGMESADSYDLSATFPASAFTGSLKHGIAAPGIIPSTTTRRLIASFPGMGIAYPYVRSIGDFSPATIDYAAATPMRGVPFAHGLTLCIIGSTTVRFSDYADSSNDWPAANYLDLPPEIGEGLMGVYWQEGISYLFGTKGIAIMSGSELESDAALRLLTAPPLAGGAQQCVARCRDQIFYLAPGPAIYNIHGGIRRIDEPINSMLRDAGDVSNIRFDYDPLNDALAVTLVSPTKQTLIYSVSQQRWLGVYRHGDSGRSISFSRLLGPMLPTDALPTERINTAPYGMIIAACDDLICRYNPSLYADDTSSSTTAAFTCALETFPQGCESSPHLDKQLLGVYVEGTGTWEVKLKHRSASNAAYTEVSLGSVAAPGWVHAPLDTAAYKERVVRVDATSASGLRVRNLAIKEALLGG